MLLKECSDDELKSPETREKLEKLMEQKKTITCTYEDCEGLNEITGVSENNVKCPTCGVIMWDYVCGNCF